MDRHPIAAPHRLSVDDAVPRLKAVTSLASGVESLSVDGGLGVLTRSFAEQLAAPTALLVVFDDDSDLATVRAAWGLSLETDGVAVRRGEGAIGRVLERGRPISHLLDFPSDDPVAATRGDQPILATVGAPLRSPAGVVGALCAGLTRRPQAERGQLVWTAQSYAAVAALCLDGSSLLGALIEAARRDQLTGCLNYGALRESLGREVSRAERHRRPLACCFVDLDDFKSINDTRGHLEGNRVLAAVANSLHQEVRAADVVGRYGGDEFVLVLPDTDRSAALVLAERVRSELRRAVERSTGVPVDVSIGVASWESGCASDELLGRADQALRIAKKAGGGVIAAPGLVGPARIRSRSPRRHLLLAVRRRLGADRRRAQPDDSFN